MNFPGVSIIIPVLNNERTIKKCLECVTFQDYPKNKVEILILDGGSTDKTIAISKSSKSINLGGQEIYRLPKSKAQFSIGFRFRQLPI
ncbi:MAG: Glycosyl transferase family 2 [Candidatus Amesbacteria bacterium GW2011_GWA1_46_35]|nr:MAG: Glycosyl transferase family 2 [Candidatus Amesbacteria bacterium GW2011_GWA1_46_35]